MPARPNQPNANPGTSVYASRGSSSLACVHQRCDGAGRSGGTGRRCRRAHRSDHEMKCRTRADAIVARMRSSATHLVLRGQLEHERRRHHERRTGNRRVDLPALWRLVPPTAGWRPHRFGVVVMAAAAEQHARDAHHLSFSLLSERAPPKLSKHPLPEAEQTHAPRS